MLILVLMLCLATAVYVALRRRDVLSLYLLGMSVCNLVMLAGIVILYIIAAWACKKLFVRRCGQLI